MPKVKTVMAALVAGMLLLWTGMAGADCHHVGKAYPEGAVACETGREFRCSALGKWQPLGTPCKLGAADGRDAAPPAKRDGATPDGSK